MSALGLATIRWRLRLAVSRRALRRCTRSKLSRGSASGRSGSMNFEQLCRLCGVPAATSEDLAAAKQHDRWSLSLVLAIADRLERDAARA